MEDRVLGATGSGASAGRRRRLRAIIRGYPIRRSLGAVLAVMIWAIWLSPASASDMVLSGSRYSAPLWSWLTAIVVSVALSIAGLAIGYWFLRKRSRLDESK